MSIASFRSETLKDFKMLIKDVDLNYQQEKALREFIYRIFKKMKFETVPIRKYTITLNKNKTMDIEYDRMKKELNLKKEQFKLLNNTLGLF